MPGLADAHDSVVGVELQRVLLECYEYWQTEPLPSEQRSICYSWVSSSHRRMFGGEFHPAKLYQLTKLGF